MIQNILCWLGIHYWRRSRRGNKFYCHNYPCKAERNWQKSDG